MVSIGPYQNKNLNESGFPKELTEMYKLKLRMVNQFVEDCVLGIEELYEEVEKVAETVKECYSAASLAGMTVKKFKQIMFVDGCFVLQFILCVTWNNKLERSDQDIAFLRRDLLLLENQLPCRVLKSLMEKHIYHQRGLTWEQVIKDFIEIRGPRFALLESDILSPFLCVLGVLIFCFEPCYCYGIGDTVIHYLMGICGIFKQEDEDYQASTTEEEKDQGHILGRLHEQLVNKKIQDADNYDFTIFDVNDDLTYFHGQYLYYSAKDLKKVGIYFKPSSSSALTDVEFKSNWLSGTLRLPPITIDMSTESMLLNLVAYEVCTCKPTEHWITAYICFMDSLINDVEDVVELRSSGIIYNYLGTDQDVADLFNEMAKDLVPNPNAYRSVKRKIDKQCQSRVKKWVAEFKHVYFRSPWTLIASTAAAVAIILTAIQTYLAAFPA